MCVRQIFDFLIDLDIFISAILLPKCINNDSFVEDATRCMVFYSHLTL